MISVGACEGNWDGAEVAEEREHLAVCCVIGDEETEVCVTQDGGDTNKSCTASGYDTNVFPGV